MVFSFMSRKLTSVVTGSLWVGIFSPIWEKKKERKKKKSISPCQGCKISVCQLYLGY